LLEAQVPAPLSMVTVWPARVVSQTTESPTATVVMAGLKDKPVPLETVKVAAWALADATTARTNSATYRRCPDLIMSGFSTWESRKASA